MDRSTFDTNVYVSALTGGRVALRLLALARDGAFALQLSDAILDEIMEVLERDFYWNRERTEQARAFLSSLSQHVTPHIELDVVPNDPDDNRILECAQASRSDYVVTREKHLLILKVHAGARILTPEEFLVVVQVLPN